MAAMMDFLTAEMSENRLAALMDLRSVALSVGQMVVRTVDSLAER